MVCPLPRIVLSQSGHERSTDCGRTTTTNNNYCYSSFEIRTDIIITIMITVIHIRRTRLDRFIQTAIFIFL